MNSVRDQLEDVYKKFLHDQLAIDGDMGFAISTELTKLTFDTLGISVEKQDKDYDELLRFEYVSIW